LDLEDKVGSFVGFVVDESKDLTRDRTIGLIVSTLEVALFYPHMLTLQVGQNACPWMHT